MHSGNAQILSMKRLPFVLLAIFSSAGCCLAGEGPAAAAIEPPAKKVKISYEIEGDYSYVGPARTETGHHDSGNLTEQNALLRLVMAPQWGEGPIFRFGIELERYSFGLPGNAPLPNTLE